MYVADAAPLSQKPIHTFDVDGEEQGRVGTMLGQPHLISRVPIFLLIHSRNFPFDSLVWTRTIEVCHVFPNHPI